MINIAIKASTREAHLALEKKVIRKIKSIQTAKDTFLHFSLVFDQDVITHPEEALPQ